MTKKNIFIDKKKLKGLSRKEQSVLRKNAILKAAFYEFVQKGFMATKMDDIAKKAGVSKGSIYIHFSSKEVLFKELIKRELGPFLRERKYSIDTKITARQKVDRFMKEVLNGLTRGNIGELILLVIKEGKTFPKIAEFYYKAIMEPGIDKIKHVLCEAAENKELRNNIIVESPELIMAPLVQILLLNVFFDKSTSVDCEKIIDTFLNVLFVEEDTERSK